eukprot:2386712-Prymnesium_polylepis.1
MATYACAVAERGSRARAGGASATVAADRRVGAQAQSLAALHRVGACRVLARDDGGERERRFHLRPLWSRDFVRLHQGSRLDGGPRVVLPSARVPRGWHWQAGGKLPAMRRRLHGVVHADATAGQRRGASGVLCQSVACRMWKMPELRDVRLPRSQATCAVPARSLLQRPPASSVWPFWRQNYERPSLVVGFLSAAALGALFAAAWVSVALCGGRAPARSMLAPLSPARACTQLLCLCSCWRVFVEVQDLCCAIVTRCLSVRPNVGKMLAQAPQSAKVERYQRCTRTRGGSE